MAVYDAGRLHYSAATAVRAGAHVPIKRDLRLLAFYGVLAVALLLLVGQLWQIQIASGAYYLQRADHNRLRIVTQKPLRGVMYDRYGQQLVHNVPSFTVTVLPADLPRDPAVEAAVYAGLGSVLGVSAEEISRLVDAGRRERYQPVRIKSQVPRDTALVLEERLVALPGVSVRPMPARSYLTGDLMGQLLGYTAPIPPERLATLLTTGYERDDTLGLTGIEAAFEEELRGLRGREQVEVNAVGRVVQHLAVLTPVQAGSNLVLTLDLELQRRVAEILAAAMARARSPQVVAVVMDSRYGDVLASVSLPTYDNNLFASGISAAEYGRLQDDSRRPLVNHAIAGQYPPGSTFKVVTAAAALQEHVVTSTTRVVSTGTLTLPGYVLRDWLQGGHGSLTVREALAQSCNTCFAMIAGGSPTASLQSLGHRRMAEYARAMGFGERTGIRLPGEAAGIVPTEEWKRQVRGESWYVGNTYNLAIGQGDLLATPLQLLNVVNAIGNGGALVRPRVVLESRTPEGEVTKAYPPEVIRRLPIAAEHLAVIRAGMRDTVASERGTAYWDINAPGLPIAGKTGTAEYAGPRDAKGKLPTHAWFAGYAPHDAPEVSVVVLVYGGGEGSAVAAPVAGEIFKAYYELQRRRS